MSSIPAVELLRIPEKKKKKKGGIAPRTHPPTPTSLHNQQPQLCAKEKTGLGLESAHGDHQHLSSPHFFRLPKQRNKQPTRKTKGRLRAKSAGQAATAAPASPPQLTGTLSGYFFLIFSPSFFLYSNGWSSLYWNFMLPGCHLPSRGLLLRLPPLPPAPLAAPRTPPVRAQRNPEPYRGSAPAADGKLGAVTSRRGPLLLLLRHDAGGAGALAGCGRGGDPSLFGEGAGGGGTGQEGMRSNK